MRAELARDEDASVFWMTALSFFASKLCSHIDLSAPLELRHVRRPLLGLRLTSHTQALTGLRIK